MKNIAIARKSIHTAKEIQKGDILTEDMLTMKRPGTGISPMEIEKIIGKKISKTIMPDTLITWSDFE